jgi:hypothetical protein
MKTLAPFLFLAGCWVGVICGFRINVRVFQVPCDPSVVGRDDRTSMRFELMIGKASAS